MLPCSLRQPPHTDVTDESQSVGPRVEAVVLVLLTIAAIVFGVINFQQRLSFDLPDDGASWSDSPQGVVASTVASNSPAQRAGIVPGDVLLTLNGAPVERAVEVTQRLWSLGTWSEARYELKRADGTFATTLVTAPAPKPLSLENYLRIVGLLYLVIGLFIFVRRWNAPRAAHFYVFCLASFVLFSFHYTGKLNTFDWEVYWAKIVALLATPALLVHFAFVFPQTSAKRQTLRRLLISACYLPPVILLIAHVGVALGTGGFVASFGARVALDQLELAYLGSYFLLAAAIFLLGYLRAPKGVVRQQLKWITGGALAATVPFAAFYIVPFSLGAVPRPWMNVSVFSLILMPLCLAYAIARYRLMDVDIIFKRGLAYTAATGALTQKPGSWRLKRRATSSTSCVELR